MRQQICIALLIALILAGAAHANITRQDTAVIQDESRLQFHVAQTYQGTQASTERGNIDAAGDGDKTISASETAAYELLQETSRLGANTTALKWDGNPTTWVDIDATTTDLENSTSGSKVAFTLVLDGTVNLTSSPGGNHTLTVTRPAGLNSYEIGVTVPGNWSIVGVTGFTILAQTNTSMSGTLPSSGIGVIQVAQGLPPPPPPLNDTTPPVLNAGADRTVTAGSLVAFNGSAADNDPGFPVNASFWWAFDYNGSQLNFSGQSFLFTFWTLGFYTVSFSATDRSGNQGGATTHVTVVSPDLEAPLTDAGPDLSAPAGEPVHLQGAAADNDPSFGSLGILWWSYTYNGTPVNSSGAVLDATFWALGTYTLSFNAMDPWGNRNTSTMALTVERPDQVAPTVNAGLDITVFAGQTSVLTGSATDNDPNFLAYGSFWWTFAYNGTTVNLTGRSPAFEFWTLGTYTLVFTAVDPWGNRNDDVAQWMVESPDKTAPTVDAGLDSTAQVGDSVLISGFAADEYPGFATSGSVWWTFAYANTTQNVSGREFTFQFELSGTFNLTLWARDAWGNTRSDTRTVVVTPVTPPTSTPSTSTPLGTSGGSGALLPVVLLALGLGGVAGVVALRRRAASLAEPALTLPSPPDPAIEGAAATRTGPTYVVEGLLVLYKDGRLIHHQASSSEAAFESPEVLGSMFTAVTEFIRDSFGQEGALSRLTYGQNTIVLDRSAHLFGAVILYGEPNAEIQETLKETLRRLESAYAGVVERWYGDRDAFKGIEGFVAPIFAATVGLDRAAVRAATGDKTVKLVSGTEHYKGYLRLRVAIANQSDEDLTDAAITVVFNQNVLHLARIEPAGLKSQGLTVHLGEVQGGERVGAIYYLDPQNCSKTNIEGIATYRDASGEERHVSMKPRVEEIICPVFFTPHHANPATMKRLVETSIAARDAKIYRVLSLPSELSYKDVFAVAREAIARHHVVQVRNIAGRSPFDGKAWFYGQTKTSKSPVIIRATVSEERHLVEIFVAVDSPATLTGLLAEFHRSFTELVRDRLPGARIDPVLDDALKGLMGSDEFEGPGTEPGTP